MCAHALAHTRARARLQVPRPSEGSRLPWRSPGGCPAAPTLRAASRAGPLAPFSFYTRACPVPSGDQAGPPSSRLSRPGPGSFPGGSVSLGGPSWWLFTLRPAGRALGLCSSGEGCAAWLGARTPAVPLARANPGAPGTRCPLRRRSPGVAAFQASRASLPTELARGPGAKARSPPPAPSRAGHWAGPAGAAGPSGRARSGGPRRRPAARPPRGGSTAPGAAGHGPACSPALRGGSARAGLHGAPHRPPAAAGAVRGRAPCRRARATGEARLRGEKLQGRSQV